MFFLTDIFMAEPLIDAVLYTLFLTGGMIAFKKRHQSWFMLCFTASIILHWWSIFLCAPFLGDKLFNKSAWVLAIASLMVACLTQNARLIHPSYISFLPGACLIDNQLTPSHLVILAVLAVVTYLRIILIQYDVQRGILFVLILGLMYFGRQSPHLFLALLPLGFLTNEYFAILLGAVACLFVFFLHPDLIWLSYLGAGIVFLTSAGRTRSYLASSELTIIIPCLNEEKNIAACLESFWNERDVKDQIIVVDGDSDDNLRGLLREKYPEVETLVEKSGGRGGQIGKGVDYARHDIIMVIHADTQLQVGALAGVRELFASDPHVCFACLRHGFSLDRLIYRFIGFANYFKVRFLNMSFGDQVQIFRKSVLDQYGGFPRYQLMEDVELSLRMGQAGRCHLVDVRVATSPRRWEKEHRLKWLCFILYLVGKYLILRRVGQHERFIAQFYQAYYPSSGRLAKSKKSNLLG